MPLYIGIDLGTSGCRAAAIDEAGTLRGSAHVELCPTRFQNQHRIQDPFEWWSATLNVLSRLFKSIPVQDVRALAVDGTSATVLLIDRNGRPRSVALMYNDDRCIEQSSLIARFAPRNSAVHGPSSSLSKILYLQHNAEVAGVRFIAHQSDWISGQLTRTFGVSDYNNVLKLGYDAARECWPSWLERVGINVGWLPRVFKPGASIATICSDLADRLGLRRDTIVCAGTTDSVAAFVASGAEQTGDAVTSLGSTLVLKILARQAIFESQYGIYSHRLDDHWLVGGASNTGGAVIRRYFDLQQIDRLSTQIDPQTDSGLDYYPLPCVGERFPISDPACQPRLEPRPPSDVQFLHGILEGIARIERRGYELLEQLGAPHPRSLRTLGGGARNATWSKMRQRLLNVPCMPARYPETACGTALLARRTYSSQEKPDARPVYPR